VIRNFDIQCNNFSMIEDTWWWLYSAEPCNVEEGWLDNKLHFRRKYMWNKWSINATGYLNTILIKKNNWVHPYFRDSINSGAFIVSKELNQDPDSFVSWEILPQAKSILSCLAQSAWHLSYIPGSYSINCTETKLAASSTFRAIQINICVTESRKNRRH
jgi:hypothetical protein